MRNPELIDGFEGDPLIYHARYYGNGQSVALSTGYQVLKTVCEAKSF